MRTFIIMALTAVMAAGLSWLLGRGKPEALSGQKGTIRPERISAWFTIVGGVAMFALGAWVAVFGDADWIGVLLAFAGAAAAGFMAPSLTSLHAVHWNANQIEGPSKMFGPTLGLARTAIKWTDIAKIDSTFTGYDYVQSRDGRRVYWSFLYKGHGALTAAIRSHCPSLS